jgi:hypothetical protein
MSALCEKQALWPPIGIRTASGGLGYETERPSLVTHQAHSATIGLSIRFEMPEKVYSRGNVGGSVDQADRETQSGGDRLRTQRVR